MHLPNAIKQKMTSAGLTEQMPGWRIIADANLLPPTPGATALFGDAVQQALRKLMQSYYNFGRQNNWTWAQSAGAAAANGGLVKGGINAVACGSFNQNFKWLAENALGITGISNGQDTSQFLTMPGGTCIDSKWVGNVRYANQDFTQLKCFKFYGHYWIMHGGINYDVCYNNTFSTTAEIIWTKLLPPDPNLTAKGNFGVKEIFRLEKPLPAGDHLVKLNAQGITGWPTWMIVPKSQVTAH